MLIFLGLYLHSLLSAALGHTIPEADQTNSAPDSEGDLLFLLDSSGSVTYDEFANVKEFIGDLLHPFKFGPQDVQASVVQISTEPTLEFPLNQHTSRQDVQKAIQKIRQRMGDTNTGKALDYVKEQLYSNAFGSRPEVPKVLVWLTDGLSTDDISQPMQLLKDMGVYVFIVCTTGRGNFQELSAAASQPDETYLKFVDKDDLGIITKELRDSIIELIKARRLHALDITTTSFRLSWPRLLSRDTGHYLLEYASIADSGKKSQMNLPGDHTNVVLTGLTPNTTYQVTLYPESNVDYLHPQTIQVTTLQEIIEKRNLEVSNITTTGFRLSWTRMSGDTGRYLLEYSVKSDPRSRTQKALSGDETSVVLSNLLPNTSYQVTLIPESRDQPVQRDTIQATTLPDLIHARNLQILNITATSFNATWSRLFGDVGRYFLDYAPISDPRRKLRKTIYGDQTTVVVSGLIPETTYQITFSPETSLEYTQSQTIQISTLPDLIQLRNLKVINITPTGFQLTWLALPGDTGSYRVSYELSSKPGVWTQTIHGETSLVIRDLSPNTSYKVTFLPISREQYSQLQTIQISTLPDSIQERHLRVLDITSTSFMITWARLSGDSGHYILEYAPASDPRRKLQKILSKDEDSVLIDGLAPDTTYSITLIPESNAPDVQDATIQVSTLPDLILSRNLHVKDKTSTSFHLAWSLLSGDTGKYVIEYAPLEDLRKALQKSFYGRPTNVLLSSLMPNTTYQVTFTPESREPMSQSQTIQVTTLPDLILSRNLHVKDKTSTSIHLAWSILSGDTGKYVIEYAPIENLRKTLRKSFYGRPSNVLLSSLMSNTTYQVIFTPASREPMSQSQTIQVTTLPEVTQIRNLQAWDISTSSFRLGWPRLPTDGGLYVLEYSLVSDPRKKLRKHLSGDKSNILISHLNPNTKYQATLYSESNVQYVPPQSIQISTLPEQVGPSRILISDPTSNSFRVSWGPHLDAVVGYEIQYGPLSGNAVETIQVDLRFNSTIIEDLKSNTTYLVTVSAIFKSGGEKSLSAMACTEVSGTKVKYLRIEDLQSNSLKAVWGSADGDVQGYQVRCRRHARTSSLVSVAPDLHSVHLTDLPEGITNRICVKPVYKDGHGRKRCKKVHMQLATPANRYSSTLPRGT